MLNDLLYYYFIFALSAAIFSYFKHYKRVQKLLEDEGHLEHPLLVKPIVGGLVWAAAAFVFAPVLLRPLLMDSHSERFITHSYEATIAE